MRFFIAALTSQRIYTHMCSSKVWNQNPFVWIFNDLSNFPQLYCVILISLFTFKKCKKKMIEFFEKIFRMLRPKSANQYKLCIRLASCSEYYRPLTSPQCRFHWELFKEHNRGGKEVRSSWQKWWEGQDVAVVING